MLRRISAVGLLTIASLVFAARFKPAETEVVDLEALLDAIVVEPTTTTTRYTYASLVPTTTTTLAPLPLGMMKIKSEILHFNRGVLQLEATFEFRVLTDIEMIRIPSESARAHQISSDADPLLEAQALELQSYRLHVVSGATETSYMYMRAMRQILEEARFCVDPPACGRLDK